MFSKYLIPFAFAAFIVSTSALTVEEQFCGSGTTSGSCPVQGYDFFTQQSIDLLSPVSPVNSAIYGAYPVVVAEHDVAKNNFIFYSTNNAPIDCTTSRALLFEVGGHEETLSDITLSQHGTTSCLANFSMKITTTDLQKSLHLVLAISDDIKSVSPALGVQISTAIIPGSLPLHIWTSIPSITDNAGAITQLNINVLANPMFNTTCLSQAAADNNEFHFQFVKPNDVIDPACKFSTENIVINTNDGTVFMETELSQMLYSPCSYDFSYANNVLTFLMKVLPDFDGCSYYDEHQYDAYLYNIFITYTFEQTEYGTVVVTTTTVEDA